MDKSGLLFKWLFKEKSIVYKIYLLAVLQGLLYVSIPLGIQGVITYIMAGSFSASLILLCTVGIIVTAFIGFFQIWQMRINETLYQKIFGDLTTLINNFLATHKPTGETLASVNKFFEVVILQKGVSKILLDFSFSVISIVFGLILLSIYSSWFLIFTVLLSTSFYLIIRYYGKQGVETNINTSNQKYKIADHFQKAALKNENFPIWFKKRKNRFLIELEKYRKFIPLSFD